MAKAAAQSTPTQIPRNAGPGRPRCPHARAAILKAAQELLEEGGIGNFSIEGVAKRAGVGKTTIYRWWATKGALVIEVFFDIVERRSPFPESGAVIEGFKTQMRGLAKLFRGHVGRAVAAIIAEAQSDPETRKAFVERYLRPRRASGMQLLARGVASGEIRKDLDHEAVADILYAPIYLRLLFKHGPLDDEAVDKMTDMVLDGLRPRENVVADSTVH